MKNSLVTVIIIFGVLFSACKKNRDEDPIITPNPVIKNALVSNTTINVPESLSKEDLQGLKNNNTTLLGDTVEGSYIYNRLRNFIFLGENASETINSVMSKIYSFNVEGAAEFDYTSEYDNRIKHVVITDSVFRNNMSWDYEMIITDSDGTRGMQAVWNKTPVVVEAIISPFNINRFDSLSSDVTMYKIIYKEKTIGLYTKELEVSITKNLPNPLDRYSMDNLKMFIGENNDYIDIFGNSNHPEATFINQQVQGGFNWAFVARASKSLNIGVSEIGLPPSMHPNNTDILSTYAIRNVFLNELRNLYPGYPDVFFENSLVGTAAPGYYDANGYIGSGTFDPGANYTSSFVDLSNMNPYIPRDVTMLEINYYE